MDHLTYEFSFLSLEEKTNQTDASVIHITYYDMFRVMFHSIVDILRNKWKNPVTYIEFHRNLVYDNKELVRHNKTEERMKRKSILQSPFAPLVFLFVILCGYIFGTNGAQSKKNQVVDAMETAVKEVNEEIEKKKQEPESEKKVSNQKKETASDAELAVTEGTCLSLTIENTYAKKVIKDYCDRNVIESNIIGMNRYNEENLYRQTFDEMSGYMNLVRLTAQKETTVSLMIATDLNDVIPVMVFPDQSYAVLTANKEVTCTLPQGNTTILYIGKKLSGSIEVRLEENSEIRKTRL